MEKSKRLELRRRGYQQFSSKSIWYIYGLIFIPCAVLIILITFHQQGNHHSHSLQNLAIGDYFRPLLPFALIVSHLLAGLIITRAKLILDDTGIIYQSGIPDKYQFIKLDWKYRWQEISGAVFKEESITNPQMSRILLKTNNKTIRLIPWYWVDPDSPQQEPARNKSLFTSKKKTIQQIRETALMKYLERRGLFHTKNIIEDPVASLNNNRRAQVIAGLFILSVIYFFSDYYFGLSEFIASTTPWLEFSIYGGVGGILAYQFLRQGKLRAQDSIIMAAMFGIGISLVSYPLVVRINTLSDKGGLKSTLYELGDNSQWLPQDKEEPILTFDNTSRFWQHFKKGDQKIFELRHGGLGITQINMEPIRAEEEKFYHNRR